MGWLRMDDGFMEHPKILPLSDRAFRLHMLALAHCARNLTDGALTAATVRYISGAIGATGRHATELVGAGLWIATADGHVVNDYLDYNPAAGTVREQRGKAKDRMASLRGRVRSDIGASLGESSPDVRANKARSSPEVLGPPTPTPRSRSKPVLDLDREQRGVAQNGHSNQSKIELLHSACGGSSDALDKLRRAARGCAEGDLVVALEACRGPGVRDRLAVALSVMKDRKKSP